jgi:hypothetical protein
VAHWGQNMIVHRFAEHYPAVFAVGKAIPTTLADGGLFSQKPDFHRGRIAIGRPHIRTFSQRAPFRACNFLDSIKFV